jgi:uncharacterized membrane protein YdcZ (DUF606 family)
MTKAFVVRAASAATVWAASATTALASGESTGTEGVAEMTVSPLQFVGMVGILLVLGGVVFAMAKFMGGSKKK